MGLSPCKLHIGMKQLVTLLQTLIIIVDIVGGSELIKVFNHLAVGVRDVSVTRMSNTKGSNIMSDFSCHILRKKLCYFNLIRSSNDGKPISA